MTPAKYLLTGILFLLHAGTLFSQSFIRLHCRHISPESGLSAAYVRKVIRDPYGYIWVGTDDGLNRFDGKNVVVYNKGLTPGRALTGSDIWDLALDTTGGRIWSINSFGGIDAIDYRTGNVVYSYLQMQHQNTKDCRFTCLALDGAWLFIGSTTGLWVLRTDSTGNGGTNARTSSEITPVHRPDRPDRPDTVNIDHLIADASGHLWLFIRGGAISVLDRKHLTVSASLTNDSLGTPSHTLLQYYDCDAGRDGRIIAGTNLGLRAFRLDAPNHIAASINPFPGIPHTQNTDIYSCRHDAKGNLWFCTAGSFARIDAADSTLYDVRENTGNDEFHWLASAFDIYFDQHDDLWLGCQQGLLFARNRKACFTGFCRSSVSNVTIQHSYSLHPVNDSIVFSAAQDGLYKVNTHSGIIDCLDTKPYYHVMLDPFNHLIASNPDGTFVVRGRSRRPIGAVYSEFRPLRKIITNSHCHIGDSLILFGTHNERGVVVWNFKSRKAFLIDKTSPDLYLKENAVTNVCRDAKGSIWVLGFNSVTIIDWRTHKVHSLNTYNPSLRKTYSIFFDMADVAGAYYLCSYGAGVLVLDSQYHFVREISTKDGLASNSIYRILPYRDSLLFITSNNGLSVIDIRHDYRIRQYKAGDGLHGDNFEEYSGSSRNGILYAGGGNGFTMIDPALMTADAPAPRLLPRQIEIQNGSGATDTANVLLTMMRIPDNTLQTTVSFSAFNYDNPDKQLFSYRIRELKGGWIDMGRRDFINFIGQSPGTYTLQVSPIDEAGNRDSSPLEIALVFLPKWYQTLAFKIAILLSIILFFYGLYRYRLSQIKQQQLIRQNISSDLHDDIGSILNTIRIFTHLAQKAEPQKTEPREAVPERAGAERYLTQIEHSLTQATAALRDMIWILDDSFDTIYELLERIRQFAGPVVTARNIQLQVSADESVYEHTLRKAEKRNLLLIAKESINNSIKYAECSRITIRFMAGPKIMAMQITDDGKGFDTRIPSTGNGLRNIAQRAAQIRYALDIHSEPGAGTKIVLQKL